jgi:hypothetical protein
MDVNNDFQASKNLRQSHKNESYSSADFEKESLKKIDNRIKINKKDEAAFYLD